jgi:hypothetical protein
MIISVCVMNPTNYKLISVRPLRVTLKVNYFKLINFQVLQARQDDDALRSPLEQPTLVRCGDVLGDGALGLILEFFIHEIHKHGMVTVHVTFS